MQTKMEREKGLEQDIKLTSKYVPSAWGITKKTKSPEEVREGVIEGSLTFLLKEESDTILQMDKKKKKSLL